MLTTFKRKLLATSGIGLWLVSCLSAPAFAQLDTIIVTAQKKEQGANDVGFTLKAFTGDMLKDRGVATSEDIALLTPGLTVNETAATGVPLYSIRGVGFQDYSTGASSTVGLYFDEVGMPYTVMSRGLVFDVERVEVLKGPQGDLYGRNTTGGQINFVSKKPTEDSEAGFSASLSSFNTVDLGAYVSGSMGERVNGRLALKTTQAGEGWQESVTRPGDKLGKKNVYALRGMLDIDVSDNIDLLLKASHVNDQSDNTANTAYDGRDVGLAEFSAPYSGLLTHVVNGTTPSWYSTGDNRASDWTNSYTDPNGLTYDLRPQRDNQLSGISARLDWDVSENITLTSVTGYDKFEREEANDWSGIPALDSSNINTSDLEVFSTELRLAGEAENLSWVGGLYYSNDTVDEFYNYFLADSVFGRGGVEFGITPFQFAPILQLHTRYKQETDSKAIFGHVEYDVTDKLGVTVGLRYTEENRDWAGCTFDAGEGSLSGFLNFAFGTALAAGDCGTVDDIPTSPNYFFGLAGGPNVNDAFHVYEDSISTNRLMGKLGLDYALNDDVLLYATFANGFKSGGFNGANSNSTTQLLPYEEEVLNSYEAGFKSTLMDGNMQLNVAAFFYDYKNKQEQDVAVTFVGNIAGLTNVPKSEIYGAEADLQWAPGDGWMVNLGAAFLETEIKEFQAVDQALSAWPNTVFRDASGGTLAQSPKWSINGGLEKEFAISNKMNLKLGGDGNYKSSTSGGVQAENATESYTVFNARIGVSNADDTWSLTAWSRNLFDEYYYPAAYQGGNGPFVRSVGMPRTFGLTLEGDF